MASKDGDSHPGAATPDDSADDFLCLQNRFEGSLQFLVSQFLHFIPFLFPFYMLLVLVLLLLPSLCQFP